MFGKLTAVALAVALALSACGGDDEPTAQEQLCTDLDSLSSSVAALRDLDLGSTSVDEVQSNLQNVKNAVDAVLQSSGEVASESRGELQTSLEGLESAVKDIPANGVEPVKSALTDVGDTAQSIADDRGCDGS